MSPIRRRVERAPTQDHALAVASVLMVAIFLLRLTFLVSSEATWKTWFLREHGLLERAEALVWGASLVLFVAIWHHAIRGGSTRLTLGWLAGLTALTLLTFGEEVAWGQYLVGVEPGAWMLTNNVQGDLTLHNLDFAALLGLPRGGVVRVLEKAFNATPYLLCLGIWIGLPLCRRYTRHRWLAALPLPRDGVTLFLAANFLAYLTVDLLIADVAELFELAIAITFLLAALDLRQKVTAT